MFDQPIRLLTEIAAAKQAIAEIESGQHDRAIALLREALTPRVAASPRAFVSTDDTLLYRPAAVRDLRVAASSRTIATR
jgi:hypothetical protein